jgi:protein ImuA
MHVPKTLDDLRQHVRALERPTARHAHVLAFGVAALDAHLPEHGLPVAALHDIGAGAGDAGLAACATLFAAGIAGRLQSPVLWCASQNDVFAPGLACAGLPPSRLFYVQADGDKTVLMAMEEALRHPGLGAVVGEVFRLSMTESRRLTLAAEKSGVMALALRRQVTETEAPNAACTRWRISPSPSAALSVPGLPRALWQVALTRCRGGTPKTWILEGCDAQGRLAVPDLLGDGQAAFAERRSA